MERRSDVFFGSPLRLRECGEKPPNITYRCFPGNPFAVGGLLNLPGVHTEHWLEHTLHGLEPGEFILWVALGSLTIALLGILVAWLVYGRKPLASPKTADPLAKPLGSVYRGMERKWWVDEFYRAVLLRPADWLAEKLAGPVDQGGIDSLVNGFGSLTRSLAGLLRQLQNGFVRFYALAIVFGVVAIVLALILQMP